MAQSKPLTIKDFLLISILYHAGCETSIRSFQELENDPKALEVYHSKKTIRRRVYRFWPHDPEGENITPENSSVAKMAGNKIQLWGATLWDFYNGAGMVRQVTSYGVGKKRRVDFISCQVKSVV